MVWLWRKQNTTIDGVRSVRDVTSAVVVSRVVSRVSPCTLIFHILVLQEEYWVWQWRKQSAAYEGVRSVRDVTTAVAVPRVASRMYPCTLIFIFWSFRTIGSCPWRKQNTTYDGARSMRDVTFSTNKQTL